MMHLIPALAHFVDTHIILASAVIFFAAVFEGEFVTLFTGILTHLRIIPLPLALILITTSAIAKTFAGYYLGVFLARRFSKNGAFKYIERRVLYFLPRFRERPFWSIFISKFIYGVNNLALIFAGFTRARFAQYFKAEMASSAIWFPALFCLGYFASYAALGVGGNIRSFSLKILLFVIGFMIIQKILNLLFELFEEYELHD